MAVNGEPLRRRDIDTERARRWRALVHGDDTTAGRHTREEPPQLRADLDLLANREGDRAALQRARAPRRDWRDSAWFDVLLATACGAALLAVAVGLVCAVVYTLVWSLT